MPDVLSTRDRFVACLLLAVGLPPAVTAAELTGYITATTDYVRRGVSQSAGDTALQAGLDVSFDNGIYAGAWGSTVDLGQRNGHHRDTQAVYYAGYAMEASDRWMLGGSVVAYTWPGTQGPVDYDYAEFSLAANYDDVFWVEYAYAPDYYQFGKDTHNIEIHAERAVFGGWMLGGGAGYFDVSRVTGAGYGYWQLGLGRDFGPLNVDVRYHDTNRPVPFLSSPERAKSRLALSLTYTFQGSR